MKAQTKGNLVMFAPKSTLTKVVFGWVFLFSLSNCLDGPDCRVDSDCLERLQCVSGWCLSKEPASAETIASQENEPAHIEKNAPAEPPSESADAGAPEQHDDGVKESLKDEPPESCPEVPKEGALSLVCATSNHCRGTRSCEDGKSVCHEQKLSQERCRNGLDDDCDGSIDEICGPRYPFAVMFAQVPFAGKYPTQYKLTHFSRTPDNNAVLRFGVYECEKIPMFVTTHSLVLRSVRILCDKADRYTYRVELTDFQGRPIKPGAIFSAVLSSFEENNMVQKETAGVFRRKDCSSLQYGEKCPVRLLYSVKMEVQGPGFYRLKSTFCQPETPLFANIYDEALMGYVTVSIEKPGECTFRTFGLRGEQKHLDFAFWFPKRDKANWAEVGADGKIVSANYFSNRKDGWNTKMVKRVGGGDPLFYELRVPVLPLENLLSSKVLYGAGAILSQPIGVLPRSSGVLYSDANSSDVLTNVGILRVQESAVKRMHAAPFFVLFVQ